jgi:DNA-binding NtrC family response regulator/GGDEF domain-containing protein
MIPAAELFADTCTCLVIIERDQGTVLEYFGRLPGVPQEGIRGRDWRDALGVPPDSTAVIAQAVKAGVSAPLPPTVIAAGADGEMVVGGMVASEYYLEREVVLLFLRRLASDDELYGERGIEPLDIVAVVGVDHLEFSPAWGSDETDRLMIELRRGLQQIVREGDWVALPAGATITVILRGLDPEAALDISRALLSHLHQRLARREGGAQYARACIGLSQRLEEQDALSAIVAANGALLQAQSGGEERIRFSSPWDPQGLAARAVNSSGAFRDSRRDMISRPYLKSLDQLGEEQLAPEVFLEHLLHATLDQGGLSAVALLQFGYDQDLTSVCAVEEVSGKRRSLGRGKLPRSLQPAVRKLGAIKPGVSPAVDSTPGTTLVPLSAGETPWGYIALVDEHSDHPGFRPSPAVLQYLAGALADLRLSPAGSVRPDPLAREMEKGIEGYVLDNMEGAVDQAAFLARVDIPIAIVGPRGIGKMYVAQTVHAEAGGSPDTLVRIDCRGFRNRNEAQEKLSQTLEGAEGRTLVFKSPHLLHADLQSRLARQLATRTVTDNQGIRYLPHCRYVALFPESITALVRKGELDQRLGSVFAGYPIEVPPLRDRGRAALRWAHKILEQESAQLDRRVSGLTPDAEQVILRHDWPGNISEMREVIKAALGRTDKEWITPVDLGIFKGITADGISSPAPERPFLEVMQEQPREEESYAPSAVDELRTALGQALAASLETGALRPLGEWLDDEVILAACDRFGSDSRGAAGFLHTRTRNIGRWMPKIVERNQEREDSLLWQDARKLARQWILETAPTELPPQQLAQDMLMSLVLQQCGDVSVADRARIMGVSTPTYQKRLKQWLQEA